VTCGDLSPAVVVVDVATGVPILTEATLDAFGNLRVSEPLTLFDSKQVFDADLAHFNVVTAGGGASTYTQQRASSILSVTAAAGDSAIRQTKRYFNYQPGKGARSDITFVLGAGDATARKQVGLFDEDNGLFLRQLGSGLWIVRRSDVSGAPVDDAVEQADWNIDPLDGTGPSGVTLDVTKAQLMRVDYEWLGTGPARVGFAIPGKGIVYAHRFGNANTLTSVYMRMPNLPVRYEIERLGAGAAPASLEAICCTIVSEGGQNQLGAVYGADRGITAVNIANTALRSVIAIRLKAGFLRRTVKPLTFEIASLLTNDNTLYRLLYNPTRGAGTAPTWVSAHALSSVEYDVSSTEILTDGIPLVPGYVQGRTLKAIEDLPTQLALGSDFAGVVPDELVLAAQAQTGSNNLLAAIQWVEL
jgi:hypothetical protein